MDATLVSVVIPCYKQAQYLRETIDSVLTQTYPNVECIVVNDGSPDDTEAVAKSYGDRVRYVARPNGGLSAARNSGIAVARGAYLKFLDSDDHLHPEQLARQMEAVGGREVVSFTAVRLYRDGHPEEYLDHIPQATALLPDLFRDYDWGGVHGYLFPTRLVRAVGGFDESVRHAEDWYFFCRVGMLGPTFVTDARVGCYYRLRAGSLSADRTGMLRSQARLLLVLHDDLRRTGRRDWFGRDLLQFEQGTFEALVRGGLTERDLHDGLLACIKELQAREGFGKYGWRFRLMTRVLGYARAERLRSFVVRLLKKRPPEALDTASWRANA